jgi:hypothetical protein
MQRLASDCCWEERAMAQAQEVTLTQQKASRVQITNMTNEKSFGLEEFS